MRTAEEKITIANEIYKQIGGRKFAVMTGSKNFYATDSGLQMDLSRNASGANKLRITLTPLDVYEMEFISLRAGKVTVKAKIEDVYGDMLESIFTEVTGLYTRL